MTPLCVLATLSTAWQGAAMPLEIGSNECNADGTCSAAKASSMLQSKISSNQARVSLLEDVQGEKRSGSGANLVEVGVDAAAAFDAADDRAKGCSLAAGKTCFITPNNRWMPEDLPGYFGCLTDCCQDFDPERIFDGFTCTDMQDFITCDDVVPLFHMPEGTLLSHICPVACSVASCQDGAAGTAGAAGMTGDATTSAGEEQPATAEAATVPALPPGQYTKLDDIPGTCIPVVKLSQGARCVHDAQCASDSCCPWYWLCQNSAGSIGNRNIWDSVTKPLVESVMPQNGGPNGLCDRNSENAMAMAAGFSDPNKCSISSFIMFEHYGIPMDWSDYNPFHPDCACDNRLKAHFLAGTWVEQCAAVASAPGAESGAAEATEASAPGAESGAEEATEASGEAGAADAGVTENANQATCATFQCPPSTHVPALSPIELCEGSACTAMECCDVKATCDIFVCSGKDVLKHAPSTIHCAGLNCTEAECCDEMAPSVAATAVEPGNYAKLEDVPGTCIPETLLPQGARCLLDAQCESGSCCPWYWLCQSHGSVGNEHLWDAVTKVVVTPTLPWNGGKNGPCDRDSPHAKSMMMGVSEPNKCSIGTFILFEHYGIPVDWSNYSPFDPDCACEDSLKAHFLAGTWVEQCSAVASGSAGTSLAAVTQEANEAAIDKQTETINDLNSEVADLQAAIVHAPADLLTSQKGIIKTFFKDMHELKAALR